MSVETTSRQAPAKAGRREWLGLAVLALPTALLSLEGTILFLAAPSLAEDLKPSSSQLLWAMDIYDFVLAGFLIIMGTLGDRIGRRKLLLTGATLFAIVSLIGATAGDPAMLIAARAVLGVAGATVMPSTLALISNMFADPRQRGVAISVWVTSFSVGIAAGPALGGVLIDAFSWRAAFLIGVPVMVLLLITGPLLLPESRDPEPGRLDLTSVALSLLAILPAVYGIKNAAEHGIGPMSLIALAVGAGFGVAFALRQRGLESPLLDLRLFGIPSFRVAVLISLFSLASLGGVYVFVTQYLQLVAGMSPLAAGLWLLPAAAALITLSALTPAITRRIRPGHVLAGALAVSAAGYLLLTQVGSSGGLPLLITGFVLLYGGTSPMMVLSTDLVVGAAPPERAGAAAAIAETSANIGVAVGIALFGSIGIALYRRDVVVPEGVPAELAAAARDTLSGASSVVGELPGELGAALLGSAREAFVTGLNHVAVVAAVVVIGLAVLSVRGLRHVPPTGEPARTES